MKKLYVAATFLAGIATCFVGLILFSFTEEPAEKKETAVIYSQAATSLFTGKYEFCRRACAIASNSNKGTT